MIFHKSLMPTNRQVTLYIRKRPKATSFTTTKRGIAWNNRAAYTSGMANSNRRRKERYRENKMMTTSQNVKNRKRFKGVG
jgi:hypothetical protein